MRAKYITPRPGPPPPPCTNRVDIISFNSISFYTICKELLLTILLLLFNFSHIKISYLLDDILNYI